MSLYIRHSAWLGAVPEKAESEHAKAPAKSRAQQMRDSVSDDTFEPDMPPCGDAGYLLDHFWNVGPTLGEGAISSGELRDYQHNMGIALTPWECRTIRRLSIDYLNEHHRATKADCPPPFAESSDAERLKRAEMRLKLDTFLN